MVSVHIWQFALAISTEGGGQLAKYVKRVQLLRVRTLTIRVMCRR